MIVSPSAIFPRDGSIKTPPASGFAFDFTSSSSSSAILDRAREAARRRRKKQETAGCEPEKQKKGLAPFENSPVHLGDYLAFSSWIRRRSASASAVFPIRRSHCSRSVNATSDSLISIERVCDATAPAKSARCRSRTPGRTTYLNHRGSNSVAVRACNSASFFRSRPFRSCAASKCAAADLSLIASAAFASARASVN